MDCKQFRERLEASMLQSPDCEWESEMLQHLGQCGECQDEFRSYQDAWLMLPAALPPTPVSDELEERVMRRAVLGRAVVNRNVATPPTSRTEWLKASMLRYVLAASVLLVLIGGTFYNFGLIGNSAPVVSDGDIERLRAIATQVEQLKELERVFSKPNLTYVSLAPKAERSLCYLVHDPTSGQIHFLCDKLRVTPGYDLKLWLLSESGEVLSSSSIEMSEDGTIGAAVLNGEAKSVRSALVTEEKQAGRTDTPSNRVVLRQQVDFS